MPNFLIRPTILAGTTNPNILAGSPFEFVGRDSKVAIAMATDVAATVGTMIANVTFGAELQLQDAVLPREAAAGEGPKLPDNVQVDDVAAAGDRLVVSVQNTDAVNDRAVACLVRILPI